MGGVVNHITVPSKTLHQEGVKQFLILLEVGFSDAQTKALFYKKIGFDLLR